MVVVSQSYFHPWEAFVDDKPAKLWRADHAFQAFEVPAGRHEAKLVYVDRMFQSGVIVSLIGILALVSWTPPGRGDETFFMFMRGVTLIGFAATVWWATAGHRLAPELRAGLAGVKPYAARACPFCDGPLLDQPNWHCPKCAVERLDLANVD